MSHTPTPYRAGLIPRGVIIRAEKVDGQPYLCQMLGDNQEANAEFMIRSCNAYDRLQAINAELLAACEEAMQELHDYADSGRSLKASHMYERLREAVAAHAKEKP